MQRIIQLSHQYQDGLLAADEYLARTALILANDRDKIESRGLADYVANAFIHGLSNTLSGSL